MGLGGEGSPRGTQEVWAVPPDVPWGGTGPGTDHGWCGAGWTWAGRRGRLPEGHDLGKLLLIGVTAGFMCVCLQRCHKDCHVQWCSPF